MYTCSMIGYIILGNSGIDVQKHCVIKNKIKSLKPHLKGQNKVDIERCNICNYYIYSTVQTPQEGVHMGENSPVST